MDSTTPRVAIIMGSSSDGPVLSKAAEALNALGVPYEMSVVSAHRMPEEMAEFARQAADRGIRVIVAGAGGAAHIPGLVAAHTTLPVIGVPVPVGPLRGMDALLSIVQMPRGVPVATVAIDGAWNAGVLAAQILASGGSEPDTALAAKLAAYKERMGWDLPWYSSFGTDFNDDFQVTREWGETHGLSVFFRLGDDVYHSYSTYNRGCESLSDIYRLLDMTPYGRQEDWEDSPAGWPQRPTYG